VLNKADLAAPPQVEERAREYRRVVQAEQEFVVSAAKSTGLEDVVSWVIGRLPEGPRLYPPEQVTDREERFLAAELIREQALLRLRAEVPHGIAVSIDEFEERESGAVHVTATIFVERESHKGIVIGAGGSVLKGISSAARLEMEQLLGRRVFLEAWVKVRPNWRRDATQLHGLGFRSRKK
jgi:GTPase